MPNSSGPIIVQSDKTVLLETGNALAGEARHELSVFAELERAPEHMHTYRLTRLGLWNARAAGHSSEWMLEILEKYSKFPIPPIVSDYITETVERYGKLQIVPAGDAIELTSTDEAVMLQIRKNKKIAELIEDSGDKHKVTVLPWARGSLKQELTKLGWPADDLAGYAPGDPLDVELEKTKKWSLRHYQVDAINRFWDGGSGVVVLPCGAGKTLVGAGVMAKADTHTLILVTNSVAAAGWRRELLMRTNLTEDEVGEYSGTVKDLKPVTIATYQILTAKTKGEYKHLEILNSKNFGLVIYDEVHLLPAPVFKLTADLQAKRRLGLTATLIREDGRETDVFSLIGPKRFDAPWKDLEAEGFIAPALCKEVRVNLTDDERLEYAAAEDRERYRLAGTTPAKIEAVRSILKLHEGEPTLVIGQYLDQLDQIAEEIDAPVLTGKTPVEERKVLFDDFRAGRIPVLVVSKVANFSVDLPDATVAIQISGTFGSRQEEAQRLGRLLRPKADGRSAHFYSVVTRETSDQEFAANRQRFLAEQGYPYEIIDLDELANA